VQGNADLHDLAGSGQRIVGPCKRYITFEVLQEHRIP